jgi:uncharacterized membrane protein (GlpM family)
MAEYLLRFVLGGLLVSLFAVLGDLLRPKSFAGLFGAAPSVAIATLGIAAAEHGSDYAAMESRSMMYGALALAAYGVAVCHLLMRTRLRAVTATLIALVVWLVVGFGLQAVLAGEA